MEKPPASNCWPITLASSLAGATRRVKIARLKGAAIANREAGSASAAARHTILRAVLTARIVDRTAIIGELGQESQPCPARRFGFRSRSRRPGPSYKPRQRGVQFSAIKNMRILPCE